MTLLLTQATDNLDYNSLKHEIKMHTTRDQATAMVIPGYEDPALAKFENALFDELCRQHDRVDLFVNSKADEILRRMGKTPTVNGRRMRSPIANRRRTPRVQH